VRRCLTTILVILATFAGVNSLRAQETTQPAQNDSLKTHILRTRDGSSLVGRLISMTPDSVHFESNGVLFALARSDVTEIRALTREEVNGGRYRLRDPNRTRLFFAPTARMLNKGEGYFSDTYLLLLGVAGGVTSNFTMGGGLSIVPSDNPQNNIFYLTPKIGLIERPDFALAAGALVGFAGFEGLDAKDRSFGILYGVSSFGSSDNHVDFGAGWGYAGGRISGDPAIMLGGAARVSDRVSFLSENYIIPSISDNAVISYGVRIFGEKLSVDLAFANAIGSHTSLVFPGIPYVAVAVKF
jgi:hypothetical protein